MGMESGYKKSARIETIIVAIPIVIIILFLIGCSGILKFFKIDYRLIEASTSGRYEVLDQIRELEEYKIVNVQHMTKGIVQLKTFKVEYPKDFNAGKFKVSFQKGDKVKNVILQTEEKVGHYARVIPGETVVDGYIQLMEEGGTAEDITLNSSENNKTVVLNKAEEKYFIEMLYKRFDKNISEKDAKYINQVKDYALAIYFNGKKGLESFHKKLSKSMEEAPAKLKSLSILVYKEKSKKTQPELATVIKDEEGLDSWQRILEDKRKLKLPEGKIKGVFIYKEEFEGKILGSTEYYIFAKMESGEGYYKKFKMTSKFEMDTYNAEKVKELIKNIGRENWFKDQYPESDHDLWRDSLLKEGK